MSNVTVRSQYASDRFSLIFSDRLLHMLKATKHTLPSGLKVVFAQMPDSPTVTVQVLVETGSKYESKKEAGLSHFLEHMCFKGTKKRPSALAVSKAFDEIGAISNAFTSTEITGYWAKAGFKNILPILDIVSDIYLNPVFKDEDVKVESGVIKEELNRYEDQPEAVLSEAFELAMHGNQPAGLPIIGNKKTVGSFKAKDFYNYHQKHYVASATTIVVAGRFNERQVLEEIKNLFKNISKSKKHNKQKTKIVHRKPRVVFVHKDIDQVHIELGTRAFSYTDNRLGKLAVMRGVLSSGMSSRLFQKMRTELGICYYISAFNSASTDHGEFGVVSGVDPKRVDVAVKAILDELKKIKNVPVPEDELKKVKALMISRMYMALESSDEVASYFGERVIFHKDLRTPEEREKAILSVTQKDIQNIAKKLFTNKDLLLAVVGRKIDKQKLAKLLNFE